MYPTIGVHFCWLFKSASDGVDKLSEEARKHPEFSATGGVRSMDFRVPPPKSVVNGGDQNSATYNVDVKQTINTNDATKAANTAVDGLTRELKRTFNNGGGVFTPN